MLQRSRKLSTRFRNKLTELVNRPLFKNHPRFYIRGFRYWKAGQEGKEKKEKRKKKKKGTRVRNEVIARGRRIELSAQDA